MSPRYLGVTTCAAKYTRYAICHPVASTTEIPFLSQPISIPSSALSTPPCLLSPFPCLNASDTPGGGGAGGWPIGQSAACFAWQTLLRMALLCGFSAQAILISAAAVPHSYESAYSGVAAGQARKATFNRSMFPAEGTITSAFAAPHCREGGEKS